MLRIIRFVAIGAILLVGIGWAVALVGRQPGEAPGAAFLRKVGALAGAGAPSVGGGLALPPGVDLGGPFSLTDQTGAAVSEQSYRGRWMLVFFGFTHCPDVCPTELQKVAAVLESLGAEAAALAPLFISVDHERDGPAQLAQYTRLFDERIIGLSGTAEQVAAVARAYRVYYARTQPAGSSTFLYDHSAFLYLMGPDGRLRAVFPPTAGPAELARTIATWVRRAG